MESRAVVTIESLEQRVLLSYSIRPINPRLDEALLSKQTVIPEQFQHSVVARFPDSQSERLFAADSNAQGLVVGYSIIYPKWHGYRSAFVWDGKWAKELDQLIVSEGHWTLDAALAIDNSGRILVSGWNDQTVQGEGKFVLTPIKNNQPVAHRSRFAYKVRDLGIFYRGVAAIGFDKRGELLVSSGFGSFIWSKTQGWHEIKGADGWFVGATAINDRGEVTGAMWMDGGESHLFRYDASGFQDLGMYQGGAIAGGTDINNRGQISGYAVDKDGVHHAVVYDSSGFVDLGTGEYADTYSISDDGKVLARIDKPVSTPFSIIPWDDFGPVAMNQNGVITSSHNDVSPPRSYAYAVWLTRGQEVQ